MRECREHQRKKKAISVYAANGILLAHYEEGYDIICEEMPQQSSTCQPDSHPPAKLT